MRLHLTLRDYVLVGRSIQSPESAEYLASPNTISGANQTQTESSVKTASLVDPISLSLPSVIGGDESNLAVERSIMAGKPLAASRTVQFSPAGVMSAQTDAHRNTMQDFRYEPIAGEASHGATYHSKFAAFRLFSGFTIN